MNPLAFTGEREESKHPLPPSINWRVVDCTPRTLPDHCLVVALRCANFSSNPTEACSSGLPSKPVSNRKNRRKTRSYCCPRAPLTLLIDQTQKRSWIVNAACHVLR